MKKSLTALLCCFAISFLFLQMESKAQEPSVFEKLTNSLKEYKPDTTTPPDDKLTRKIIQLRNLKGGFNINEALDFKMGEELDEKGESVKAQVEKFKAFFSSGEGKKWLDNAVIWIYRQEFTYKEVKKLVRFYKTPAGQKLSAALPVIILKSMAAADIIKDKAFTIDKKQN